MKTDIQIVPYGELLSPLSSSRSRGLGKHARISTPLHRMSRGRRSVVITFSRDLDQSFIKLFRAKATEHTKLLILNEGTSADTLLSRIMELPVRTPQRLCVLDSFVRLWENVLRTVSPRPLATARFRPCRR